VLLAQDFVALLDKLPKDLIGVALAAAGGYFLWLKFTGYVDNLMVPYFDMHVGSWHRCRELDDGRYTVFVPSIPTPFAGAVYVLDRQRVHPVDVPFTDAVKVVTRWGSGAKGLVAAMEKGRGR